MTAERGFLLDLVARRYPGTRPSDLYGRKSEDNPDGLDELQAWEFDSGLAYRQSLKDRDQDKRDLHEIIQAIKLTGRYHGLKKIKYEKYKSILTNLATAEDEDEDDAPEVDDALLIKLNKGSVIDNVTVSRNDL